MNGRRYRSVAISRLVAVGALLVINILLSLLIADDRDFVDLFDDGPEGQSSSIEVTPGAEGGATSENAATADDWPGGRGPEPDGPPKRRETLLFSDGRLVLSGSAPSWRVVTELVGLAAGRFSDGAVAVENRLTWHPEASPLPQSGTVRLDPSLLYSAGQTTIPGDARAGLDLVAEVLKVNPTVFAVIVGHTDDLGETEENLTVALARSRNVVDYLQDRGASAAQLVIAAPPSGDPVVQNETDGGRIINRRVEVRLENLLSSGPDGVG